MFYVPALQKHLPLGGKLSKKFHSFGREEYQPGANPLIIPIYNLHAVHKEYTVLGVFRPEMEFLDTTLIKKLESLHISGFKNPCKKIPKTRKLESFHE
jgi:hypothetical protein